MMTAMAPPCFYLPITTRLPPPFHVLLLFYDCDPFITLPPPLPVLIPSFLKPCCVFPSHWCLSLLAHRLSFYWFVGWVSPFPVASKQCVKEALVCCQKILSKNMCMTL